MIKRRLSEGLVQYIFEPLAHLQFGNSIYAVIESEKVLLIDAAFDFQAAEAINDLEENGLSVTGVIISHFHDDHMQGLKALPKATVYGSASYQETLDMWNPPEEHAFYRPTVQINVTTRIPFGDRKIKLIPFPGHSLCTVLTRIDDTYLHIADEVMFAADGRLLLPSVDGNDIGRHITSLARLKAYNTDIFLPAHGTLFDGRENIGREIDGRLAYFENILASSAPISYEEAIKNCGCDFAHSEWHMSIYE